MKNNEAGVKRYQKAPKTYMLNRAKRRAKEQGVPFSISESDIVIPERCPLLGLELVFSKGASSDNSPSLDKIVPSEGYVAGNIQVISHKANAMKSNASLESLVSIGNWAAQVLAKKKGQV